MLILKFLLFRDPPPQLTIRETSREKALMGDLHWVPPLRDG